MLSNGYRNITGYFRHSGWRKMNAVYKKFVIVWYITTMSGFESTEFSKKSIRISVEVNPPIPKLLTAIFFPGKFFCSIF